MSTLLCPDLRPDWKLGKLKDSQQYILQERQGKHIFLFSEIEGFALQYFTGSYSVKRVQRLCEQQFGERVCSDLVVKLLATLEELGSRGAEEVGGQRSGGAGESEAFSPAHLPTADNEQLPITNEQFPIDNPQPTAPTPNPLPTAHLPTAKPQPPAPKSALKPEVQWFSHPDGHWILRNPKDFTFLQVNAVGKAVTDDLGRLSLHEIAAQHGLSLGELKQHLGLLTATGMLAGTTPQKGKKGKWTPMDLLFFLWPLFNPDAWLSRHLGKVRWMFARFLAWGLLAFLAYGAAVGLSQRQAIAAWGMKLWQGSGSSLILPFVVLSLLVVSLHELAHAFTLKHYGGIVPEMGLMFMCLFPAAYTDTTDAYCLVKKRQRVWVVAAGVLCQLAIATLALGLWNLSVRGSWLHTGSYLLLVAALFTVAVNLNPLAKFDGYYLAVAASGINNLRSRSFLFYLKLVSGQPLHERARDAWILALYAPLSLAYLWLVFGFLFCRLGDWILTHIPFLALTLLALWGIYYFFPSRE